MDLARSELKRIDELEKAKNQRSKAQLNKKKKSVSKTRVGNKYDTVQSRLFQSIESSKAKQQPKFADKDAGKRVDYKKSKKDDKSRFQSHGRPGILSD